MSDFTAASPDDPGWHEDETGRVRWWDGSSWGQYRDAAPVPPAPPARPTPPAPPKPPTAPETVAPVAPPEVVAPAPATPEPAPPAQATAPTPAGPPPQAAVPFPAPGRYPPQQQPSPAGPAGPVATPAGGQYSGAGLGYRGSGGPVPPKKSHLGLILAIIGLVVVLIGGALGLYFLLLGSGSSSDKPRGDESTSAATSDKEQVKDTYVEYIGAYNTGDCDAYKNSTTESLRDDEFDGDFSCSAFRSSALPADADWEVTYDISTVSIDGDTATMTVDEEYPEDPDNPGDGSRTQTYDYNLVKTDGVWLIDWSSWY